MKKPKTIFNKKTERFFQDHDFITRRDFLSVISMSFTAGAISPLLLMSPELKAENSIDYSGNIPFVTIDGMGGVNIAGNVIIGKGKSTDFQEDYAYQGWQNSDYMLVGIPPDHHPGLAGNGPYDDLGLKFHRTSGLYKGIMDILKDEQVNGKFITDMIDGLVFCHRGNDDTNTNPFNSSYAINKVGLKGSLTNLMGNRSTANGGSTFSPDATIDASYRSIPILDPQSAINLASLGDLGNKVISHQTEGGTTRVSKFLELISNISKAKIEKLAQFEKNAKIVSQLKAAYDPKKHEGILSNFNAQTLDPFNKKNEHYSTYNNLNAYFYEKAKNSEGSIVPVHHSKRNIIWGHLLTEGYVGACTSAFTGCDYHDGSASSGYLKDIEMGRTIGELIYIAAHKGKSIVFDLVTDGSCLADRGGKLDNSTHGNGRVALYTDSPIQCASVMLVYHHGKTRTESPKVEAINGKFRRQIGSFGKGQGAINLGGTAIANNPENVWKIKTLNYMALIGTYSAREVQGQFEEWFGVRLDGMKNYQDLVRFKSIV